jgi:serine/threonine-protein kinase
LSQALVMTPYFTGARADAVRPEVIATATRALSLDTSLARAYVALGVAYMHAWQWREARAAYERAVAADANDLETRLQFGRFLFYMGDDGGALAQWRRAQTVDPFYAVPAAWIALVSATQGNRAEAEAQVRRAVQYDSGSTAVKTVGGFARFYLGDTAGVRALMIGLAPVPPLGGELAYLLARIGDTSGARAVLRKLESPSTPAGFVATALALTYLGLADTSRALDARDARWEALVRRVGLDSVQGALAPSARK